MEGACGTGGLKRGGAGGDTGLPLSARSLRDGTAKRIAERGGKGSGETTWKGLKCYRDEREGWSRLRQVPAARIYEFTRTSEPTRESGRASAPFFATLNFLHGPVVEAQGKAR